MYDCIIIGAGPSGLMAGIKAKENNKILILEKNNKAGKKLLLTGNGRCNITNLKEEKMFLENIKTNKKHLYSTINNFSPSDIYTFFVSNGIPLKEEEDNKIFPKSDKSFDILHVLLSKFTKEEIKYNEEVTKIDYEENNIKVITQNGMYLTKNIIVATGGASFKQTGSTGDHMKFANMLEQPTIDLYPCEVGILTKEKNNLQGTSFNNVKIKYLKHEKIGKLIYTHKGLSGSAIMELSEYIYQNEEKKIIIDFIPTKREEELIREINEFNKEKELSTYFVNYFTKRFTTYLIEKLNYNQNIKIKNLNTKMVHDIIKIIKEHEIIIDKVDDINNAYVTGGGIDMKYINSKTMESTIKKGVYFVGESLDIHGPIGGYNLTLALSTGYTAGISIN